MIHKIISGGQTGADQGGLEAAKELGIETGGFAPPRYFTDDGPNPKLLKSFGLKSVDDPKVYPKRTRLNVDNSDGTLWVGRTTSPGARLTIGYAKGRKKPIILNPSSIYLKKWCDKKNIKVLNVAGNRERMNVGIKEKTKRLIINAFSDD